MILSIVYDTSGKRKNGIILPPPPKDTRPFDTSGAMEVYFRQLHKNSQSKEKQPVLGLSGHCHALCGENTTNSPLPVSGSDLSGDPFSVMI